MFFFFLHFSFVNFIAAFCGYTIAKADTAIALRSIVQHYR